MLTKTENAIIKSTMLGYEDHGIMTYMLQLDREIGSQGFGGYALKGGKADNKHIQAAYGMDTITSILNTVGVDTWEELKNKHIRIMCEEGWNGKILGIGNIIKDKWFYPKELGKQYFPEKQDV